MSFSNSITVSDLKKEFSVSSPAKSLKGKLIQFFSPKCEILKAVNGISFQIRRGEKVAFIGPNGAGKSTTIKLLTGIFQPTSGKVDIFGLDPFSQRKKVAHKIGTVFGQRSQLWYHLPAYHSFKLLATIYDIDKKQFEERLSHLCHLFQLDRFISRPVKELSLGERMRCELVSSLLHNPEILFLDEPTIGLDIISKAAIREFIQQRAELHDTTIFLTSHDVADIERVCDRMILINNGKIVLDESVKTVKKRYLNCKHMTVKADEPLPWHTHAGMQLMEEKKGVYLFKVDMNLMTPQEAITYISQHYRFTDITIEDPPLEEIIKGIYQS